MPGRLRLVTLAVMLLAGPAAADVPMHPAFSIERLATGNTLIAAGSTNGIASGLAVEVDSLRRLVWTYVRNDVPWTHSARRLADGNTLITATLANRVIEVDAVGNTVWECGTSLSYPNEALRLPTGNTLITDRDNNRVIEVDPGGTVVWSYTNLHGPHGGSRLSDGNTLICDSDSDRVVEVTPDSQVVWQYSGGLDWPRSAQRLAGGSTLIVDSKNQLVIEVDSAGAILWNYSTFPREPYMAIRLANGNTLISAENQVSEVSPGGTVLWLYPPKAPAVETLRVVNPASGCSLYVHIHHPSSATPDNRVPGIVLVPDESYAGTTFDTSGLADHIASDGFAVLHFDADGRGSSPGSEDYNGIVAQEGLHACIEMLAVKDYVDTTRLGFYSQGYGVVMATGLLAHHPTPEVKFLLDFEGPSDRYQVCADSGGHVPVSPDSESFWTEREAGRFIKSVSCAYLRIQTAIDHTNRIPDNRHCVALVDSATAVAHGGAGTAVWTRVNDSVMNDENVAYSIAQPPEWINDFEESLLLCRELLYLHELADRDFTSAVSSQSFIPHLSTLSISPNPCRDRVTIRFSSLLPNPYSLSLYNASGRLVLSQPVRHSSFDIRTSSLPAGVYLARLAVGGRAATASLVVR